MGGSNPPQTESRGKRRESHGGFGYDRPERLAQDLHETPKAMDVSRHDYHDLLLKYDGLKHVSAAQEEELAFYRKIMSETSSDEMRHQMNEVQDRLREFSVSLDWFTTENYKVFHANDKRSQHKFSMRENLDRLSRALVIVTEENKALKEESRLMAEKLSELEADESESTAESEDQVRSGISTLHRKKSMSNLRSQKIERHALSSRVPDEQLMRSEQRPSNDLLAEISATRTDLLTLQSKLSSAEAHIINIGGNLGALLPRETVKNEFSSLVGAIQIWVTDFVSPSISSAEQCVQASERARNAWVGDMTLGMSRARNQDFRAASKFPGADESIFLVLIFDILVDQVFSAKILYTNQDLQRQIDVIKQLESSTRLSSESSRSLYNSRRWMSEAMTAILACEETRAIRDDFSHILASFIIREIGLAALLGPENKVALEAATASIQRDVVLPAIELGDKMACSIDKYSLDVPSYWSKPCVFQNQFFRDLDNLDCKNFGEGPPRFRLDKMKTQLSEHEIKSQLRAICPAIPALMLTEVDDKAWGPPTILVKQQVWVSWHAKRIGTLRLGEQGYFWLVYNREAGPRKQ